MIEMCPVCKGSTYKNDKPCTACDSTGMVPIASKSTIPKLVTTYFDLLDPDNAMKNDE